MPLIILIILIIPDYTDLTDLLNRIFPPNEALEKFRIDWNSIRKIRVIRGESTLNSGSHIGFRGESIISARVYIPETCGRQGLVWNSLRCTWSGEVVALARSGCFKILPQDAEGCTLEACAPLKKIVSFILIDGLRFLPPLFRAPLARHRCRCVHKRRTPPGGRGRCLPDPALPGAWHPRTTPAVPPS